MKIVLLLFIIAISSIINAETYRAFDEDSLSKHTYIVEIKNNEVVYTTRAVEDATGKKRELVSKGTITGNVIHFYSQSANGRERAVSFDLDFKVDGNTVIIKGDKYLKENEKN